MSSPTVWTSLATGQAPDAHGVTSFFATPRGATAPEAAEDDAVRERLRSLGYVE